MNVQLTLYEALLAASVPAEHARKVAEVLDTDMDQFVTKEYLRDQLSLVEARLLSRMDRNSYMLIGTFIGVAGLFKLFA